jgi:hypothetical protein
MTENYKLRKAILSATFCNETLEYYQFCDALSSCGDIFVQTCLDQHLVYNANGRPFVWFIYWKLRIDRDPTTSEKYKKNFDVSSEGPSSGS